MRLTHRERSFTDESVISETPVGEIRIFIDGVAFEFHERFTEIINQCL